MNHRNFASLQSHLIFAAFAAALFTGCVDPEGYPTAETNPPVSGATGPCNNNDTCDADESPLSCPADCPTDGDTCGNGDCDPGETPLSCPMDCTPDATCGDGTCDADEDADSCADDCVVCGDDECNGDENIDSCAADCPPVCGDGVCSEDDGEDRATCPSDCCDYQYDGSVGGIYRAMPDMNDPGRTIDVYSGDLGDLSGGGDPEFVQASFRDGIARFIGGTFDLGTGNNARMDDCEQCVRVVEDVDIVNMMPAGQYFQTQGTLEVVGKPFLGNATMTLTDAVFHIVEGGAPNLSGACFYLNDLQIDTDAACGDGVCSVDESIGCDVDCFCGNGTCDEGEHENNCPADCELAASQGNFRCDGLENKDNTPQDCCEVSIKSDPGDDPLDSNMLLDDNILGYGTRLPNLIGGPAPEWLELQFWDANVSGAVDLASDPNDNFETCDQCILLLQDRPDLDVELGWNAAYFQRQGELFVNRPPTVDDPGMQVRFDQLVLEEVDIAWDDGGTSTPVPGGRCLYIDGVYMEHQP